MLLFPSPRFRKRRGHAKRKPPTPPPPAAPTLVSAIYEGDDSPELLTLGFDRAVDTSGLVGTAIVVRDGALNARLYKATGPITRPDAMTVRIQLVDNGPIVGEDVQLTASSSNGIVAVDGGAAWSGVTNVVLPYP